MDFGRSLQAIITNQFMFFDRETRNSKVKISGPALHKVVSLLERLEWEMYDHYESISGVRQLLAGVDDAYDALS